LKLEFNYENLKKLLIGLRFTLFIIFDFIFRGKEVKLFTFLTGDSQDEFNKI